MFLFTTIIPGPFFAATLTLPPRAAPPLAPPPPDGLSCERSAIYQWHTLFNYSETLQMFKVNVTPPIPVAAQSKVSVYGRSLAGIVSSNPAGCMVRLL